MCYYFIHLLFFANLSCFINAVSRQDERESELRDENSKLHTKYSEVMLYKHVLMLTAALKYAKLECDISPEGKLISELPQHKTVVNPVNSVVIVL